MDSDDAFSRTSPLTDLTDDSDAAKTNTRTDEGGESLDIFDDQDTTLYNGQDQVCDVDVMLSGCADRMSSDI